MEESFSNLSNISIDTTKMNKSIDHSMTTLQIFSTIFFFLTASCSLAAYILVLTILYLYFKEFKTNFYFIVISLAGADMIFMCLVLFYMIPCTLLKKVIWISVPYIPGLFNQMGYFAMCTHLTYIAVNRLIYASVKGISHPRLDKIFGHRYSVTFWIGFLWIIPVVLPIMVRMAGCDSLYDQEYMAFAYNCQPINTPKFTEQILLVDNFIAGFLPSLVTALHILAWCVIYYRGRQHGVSSEILQHRKREIRLLIQFSLISLNLFFLYASFWIIPYLFGSSCPELVIISFFGMASTGVNPWTYLFFNKLMKAKAKYLIWDILLKQNLTSVHPIAHG